MNQILDQTASAIFQIKSFEEVPFAEIPIGPKLTRGSYVFTYQGELEGEGVLEELKVHFPGNCAVFWGIQRFTGKLAGMEGSFVLKHSGRFVGGKVNTNLTVVPGSGTDALKGLRGEMKTRSFETKEFPVTFNYHFA